MPTISAHALSFLITVESFPERISIGPHPLRESLIDDSDIAAPIRPNGVTISEEASAEQRDLHHSEIVGRDRLIVYLWVLLPLIDRLVFD